jgi:hypothetical protein
MSRWNEYTGVTDDHKFKIGDTCITQGFSDPKECGLEVAIVGHTRNGYYIVERLDGFGFGWGSKVTVCTEGGLRSRTSMTDAELAKKLADYFVDEIAEDEDVADLVREWKARRK